jgi:hypothetical protein
VVGAQGGQWTNRGGVLRTLCRKYALKKEKKRKKIKKKRIRGVQNFPSYNVVFCFQDNEIFDMQDACKGTWAANPIIRLNRNKPSTIRSFSPSKPSKQI